MILVVQWVMGLTIPSQLCLIIYSRNYFLVVPEWFPQINVGYCYSHYLGYASLVQEAMHAYLQVELE